MATGDKLVNLDALKLVYDSTYTRSQIDNKINQSDGVRNLKTYTSVTQLGLTSGSATILSAFNAMPDQSALYARSDEFASGVTPSAGLVEIIRRQDARTYIAFYSKNAATHDYRMYEGPTEYNSQNQNAPTGNWVQQWDSQSPIPVTGGGTGSSTAPAARAALDVFSKSEVVPKVISYNGNIDNVKYTSLLYLSNATGTITGGATVQGKFHGMLLTCANGEETRAIQLHVALWTTGIAMRRFEGSEWTEWIKLSKATEQIRNVTIPYNLDGGASMHTNLRTIIDADMPSGYVYAGLSGFMSGNSGVVITQCNYMSTDWSFTARNVGPTNVTTNAIVYYICKMA